MTAKKKVAKKKAGKKKAYGHELDGFGQCGRSPGEESVNAAPTWLHPRPGRRCRYGDRTFKLHSGTTSEYGRYVKSLGEPRGG